MEAWRAFENPPGLRRGSPRRFSTRRPTPGAGVRAGPPGVRSSRLRPFKTRGGRPSRLPRRCQTRRPSPGGVRTFRRSAPGSSRSGPTSRPTPERCERSFSPRPPEGTVFGGGLRSRRGIAGRDRERRDRHPRRLGAPARGGGGARARSDQADERRPCRPLLGPGGADRHRVRALTNLEQGALWNVYLLSGREATWRGDSLPLPHLWMHQLRGFDPEVRLDAERFAAEAQRLLGAE